MPIPPEEAVKNQQKDIAPKVDKACIYLDQELSKGRRSITLDETDLRVTDTICNLYRQLGWKVNIKIEVSCRNESYTTYFFNS